MGPEQAPADAGVVEAVELCWLDLHLARPHRAAHGEEVARPVVLARVSVGGVEGWGECAALEAPTYREEHAAGAWSVLADHLVPRLLGTAVPAVAVGRSGSATGDPAAQWTGEAAAVGGGSRGQAPALASALMPALAAVAAALAPVQGHPMAKAALELAVVDAALVAAGCSLADALGVMPDRVPAGAVVGLDADPESVADRAAAAVDAGYRRVRCKIAPGADVAVLAAVRRVLPSTMLQADANGAYDRTSARGLAALDPIGLICLEQPLPAPDLVGHGLLARELGTPLCLDESLRTPADVETAAALGAASVVCLKPSCLGGLGSVLAARELAVTSGLQLFVGGMLQTGLGRAVDAAVAGLPGFTLPGDLGGPEAAFGEGDPFGPVPWQQGEVVVHRGPGTGPRPDPALLRKVVTGRRLSRAHRST